MLYEVITPASPRVKVPVLLKAAEFVMVVVAPVNETLYPAAAVANVVMVVAP